ncbi:MAG: 4a-hydroxytetrahydrobiopterin dehydratase [Terriglobales bacterium]
MHNELVKKSCAPCEKGTSPLHGAALDHLKSEVPEWQVVNGHHLHRGYKFADFASALRFVNRIGEIAEAEQHHPDIGLGWGRVDVDTFTHSISGLSENDFILAAKIESAHRALPK